MLPHARPFILAVLLALPLVAHARTGGPPPAPLPSFRVIPSHVPLSVADRVPGQDPDEIKIDKKAIKKKCQPCHEIEEAGYIRDRRHFLNQRAPLDRDEWAQEMNLAGKCGVCHSLPEPEMVPKHRWGEVLDHMHGVMQKKAWPVTYTDNDWDDFFHYYMMYATELEPLPPDPQPSGLSFTRMPIGVQPPRGAMPKVANVNVVDVDEDGRLEVLTCDFSLGGVGRIRFDSLEGWIEQPVVNNKFPGKTEVFDFEGDGDNDIVLASVGSMIPTEDLVGSVHLLINDGAENFERVRILDGVGRLSDARPGDFDGDGDIDFAVTVFGYMTVGGVGWIEQVDSMKFEYHWLIRKDGGIHVIPTDLDEDGHLDFVAVIAQEHEEIVAFMNSGGGNFTPTIIYKAFGPTFGSSGIDLVDMDGDDDLDILYTNGDAVDLPKPLILPYHGVQWLENKGDLEFEYHNIYSFYGTYRAVTGDMDNDGDLDIVAVTMINEWKDPTRMSIIWLENDGDAEFKPHGISNDPNYLISVSLGDMDQDGDLDIVTGGMHVFDTTGRIGRVVMFRNDGEMDEED